MYKVCHIVLCVLAVLGLIRSCEAKDWRGITPLRSTKADVVRLLGTAVNSNDVRSIYQFEDEEVYIVFSGSQLCNSPSIPRGTVLLIQVTPRRRLSLIDLKLDKNKFKEFSPSSQDPNWKGLIDEEEGLIVRGYKDKIDKVFYFASEKDRSLCQNYYAEPEKFAQVVVDFTSGVFDEYSDLAFVDEKARLDNFAIYLLKEKPGWKGYIVAYTGSNGITDTQTRLNRAKAYLISLGLDNGHISTVIGGSRDKFTIELYALPPDLPAPRPRTH
jgi:hypothetical protein